MTQEGGIVYWKIINLLRFIRSTKIRRGGYYVPGPMAGLEYTVTNTMDVVPDLRGKSLVREIDTQNSI